jgi:hypothetical protein
LRNSSSARIILIQHAVSFYHQNLRIKAIDDIIIIPVSAKNVIMIRVVLSILNDRLFGIA